MSGASSNEATKPATGGNEHTSQASVFDAKQGSIGSAFTTEGAIGGTAQKIGGPLAADGAIGKNFTEQGSIGGTVQEKLADKK